MSEAASETAVRAAMPPKEEALAMLRRMWEIRIFEDTVYELLGRDVIKGASHLYAGQEAVAVGAMEAIGEGDFITSTHRGHGHCHAHGDKHAKTSEAKQEHLNRMMAELFGRATGYCRGRGGSMHIADVSKGNLGATGIVGGNIPVATGAGLSVQMRRTDQVVLCFFGDGATNTGNFHESLNMAAIWKLPVVYICENNLYGMSVPFRNVSNCPDVAQRASAYLIPGVTVDGMDVLAVQGAVAEAVARARAGEGPTLIECKTYRYYGHSRSDPRAYRSKEEEQLWHDRDPISRFAKILLDEGVATQEELDAVETKAEESIQKSVDFAMESPMPDPSGLYEDVYAPVEYTPEQYQRDVELRELVHKGESGPEMTYGDALNAALREEMLRDERVYIMGEDVGLYGGAYAVTRGLFNEFGGERVRDTPISEAGIAGAGVGAAMTGMRPVVEIMYVDFTPLSMDQLANQGAKNRYMFGGKTSVPLVVRTEGGAGRSIAAHHSQSLEALWTHFPGIYVVMPSTPYDAKGLLKAAMRQDNPVMFIEHKMLYRVKGVVPEEDYIVPLGVADVKHEGSDVTVITYSRQVHNALAAATTLAEDDISAEVIDLRSLKPLDLDTIVASVKKTGRVVVVTEGYRNNGFTSELVAQINETAFDWLDAPVERVCAADVPVPMSQTLEDTAIPDAADIVAAVRKVLR